MPTKSDFELAPLTDHGITISRTPVTLTEDNVTGDLVKSEGSPANISAVIMNPNIIYDLMEQGEHKNKQVNLYVSGDVTINKEDKLTIRSSDFRVESVSPINFGSDTILKKVVIYGI